MAVQEAAPSTPAEPPQINTQLKTVLECKRSLKTFPPAHIVTPKPLLCRNSGTPAAQVLSCLCRCPQAPCLLELNVYRCASPRRSLEIRGKLGSEQFKWPRNTGLVPQFVSHNLCLTPRLPPPRPRVIKLALTQFTGASARRLEELQNVRDTLPRTVLSVTLAARSDQALHNFPLGADTAWGPRESNPKSYVGRECLIAPEEEKPSPSELSLG